MVKSWVHMSITLKTMSAMMKVLKAGDVVILASRLDRCRSQTPLSCTRVQHRLDARPTALGFARGVGGWTGSKFDEGGSPA